MCVCVCVCVINAHLAYIITTTESMTYTFSVLTGDSGKSGTRTCTYKVTCRVVLREHLTPPPSATHEEAKSAPEAPLGAGGAGAGAFTYTHRDVILYALGGGCGLVFGPLRVMVQHLLHFQLEPPCHRLILLNSSSCMKVTRTSPCCLHLLSSLPRYGEWSGDWLLSYSVDILLFLYSWTLLYDNMHACISFYLACDSSKNTCVSHVHVVVVSHGIGQMVPNLICKFFF